MRTRCLALVILGLATAPSAAASTLSWTRPAKITGRVAMAAVTCQSPSLCVAVGSEGRVFVSSDPSGGAVTWKVRHVDGSAKVEAVSCPSAALCAAYDDRGNVLVSTRPLRGPSTWRRVASDRRLDSFTCPSRSLCVGVDSIGRVITSTDPARASSWRTLSIDDSSPTYECVHYQDPGACAQRSLTGVSCPSAVLCTALDQAGNVVLSTDPPSSNWVVVYAEPPDSPSGLTAVSCTSAHFCFGTDNWGNFVASANPNPGHSAWAAAGLNTDGAENNPDTPLDHMFGEAACSSPSACIATSVQHRLFATGNPVARQPVWTRMPIGDVASIGCAGHGWCFAIAPQGRVYATHSHGWARAFEDRARVVRFSCPSAKFCVAVDGLGRVATGTSAQRRR